MEISKRRTTIFFVVLVFFAGSNIGSIAGIGIIFKMASNALTLYILYLLANQILRRHAIKKVSLITIFYLLYLGVYIAVTLFIGEESLQESILSMIKSGISLVWLDQQMREDYTVLDGPIMAAFYVWCILDTVITFIYPGGAPFLNGGYILGWKNNKIMYFVILHLLSNYHYIRLRNQKKKINFMILWITMIVGSVLNALLIESSTTAVVIFLLVLFVPLRRLITRMPFTNGKFVLIFHLLCFILLIFVRELFQEPLNEIMQLLFEKDATFTGRIYIWRVAMVMIVESPLIGYGKYPAQIAVLPGGYLYSWTMAHNQILDLMMRGGVIILILWLSTLIASVHTKRRRSIYSKLSIYTMFCFLFFFHTEASMDALSYLIFLSIYLIGNTKIARV